MPVFNATVSITRVFNGFFDEEIEADSEEEVNTILKSKYTDIDDCELDFDEEYIQIDIIDNIK